MGNLKLTVDEARAVILDGIQPLESELVPVGEVTGRIAAREIRARLTQPPFAASAMDGFAVRFENAQEGARLKVIGESLAGAPFDGVVGDGEAVRIYTGCAVPDGADHVLVSEEASIDDGVVVVAAQQSRPRHIRAAGIDFHRGDVVVRRGEMLHEIHGSILAAANVAEVPVVRRPRVAMFSTGDELAEPGSTLRPGQVVNSNRFALASLVGRWGGEPWYIGHATDSEGAISRLIDRGRSADVLVPIGGASVGDYDFVKSAFAGLGGELAFERVVVKPGKPVWGGRLDSVRVVGLPGNPGAALVTASLFLQPLVRRMAGTDRSSHGPSRAVLTTSLDSNERSEAYLRAKATVSADGTLEVTPTGEQDSSLISPFAEANALIKRAVGSTAADVGTEVDIVLLR